MLQVISGKFFTTTDLHEYKGKSVLFSNYGWIGKIDTCVGSIEPVIDNNKGNITTYVFQYTNRIEKEKSFPAVRIGDSEIADQFRLLCTFWFKSYFNAEKSVVDQYCQNSPLLPSNPFDPVPISRIFNKHIFGVLAEAEGFPAFVKKVIGLERKVYEQVISSFYQLFNALELSRHNIDLAYSMLVYVLESYAQLFDNFQPSWDDYDPPIRDKLNAVLNEFPSDQVNNIQEILISSKNFRAQQRFIDFVESFTRDDFFIGQSRGLKFCIRKSELRAALRNAYKLRSNFTHELQPIQEQLRHENIAEYDTFHWDNQPYLTFKGLFRLTYHVVEEFISSRLQVDREEYAYFTEFPGSVPMKLSPQYWIANPNFQGKDAVKRLSGLLQILEDASFHNGKLVNIKELIELIQKQYHQATKEFRPSLFAIHYIYNTIAPEEIRASQSESFIQDNIEIFDACSIEALISKNILGEECNWDLAICEDVIKTYLMKKTSPNSLEIPLLLEMGMITNLANGFLYSGSKEKYSEWLQYAITDLPGQSEYQNYIRNCLDQEEPVYLFEFIRGQALITTNSE
jgi:hypothetical protein